MEVFNIYFVLGKRCCKHFLLGEMSRFITDFKKMKTKYGDSSCITPRRGFMYNSLVYSWWSCLQNQITVILYMYMIFDIFYVGGKQDFEPNSSTRKSRCVADWKLSKKPVHESCQLRQYSFSSEMGGYGHSPSEDMDIAVERAFLWRWQILSLLVQCGTGQTHCAVHSSLCRGSEGTETVRHGFLPCVLRLDSLLLSRGSNVHGLVGLAICRWSKSSEVSWKVVRTEENEKHTAYAVLHVPFCSFILIHLFFFLL